MSRVFSTTIIEKIARMPNPATAMMKNSRMFRMLCSIGTAASSGPCFCSQVETRKYIGRSGSSASWSLSARASRSTPGLHLDLDLVDRAAAWDPQQPDLLQTLERARRRASSRTRSCRS